MSAPLRSADGVYHIWRNGDKGFMSKRGVQKVAEYRSGIVALEGGFGEAGEGTGEGTAGGKGIGEYILDRWFLGDESSGGEDEEEPGVLESLLAWAMPGAEVKEGAAPEARKKGQRARAKGRSVAERGDGSVTFRVSKGRSQSREDEGIDVQIGDVIWACDRRGPAREKLPILVEDVFPGQEDLFNALTRPVFRRGDLGGERSGARRSRAKFTAYIVGRVTGSIHREGVDAGLE